MQYGLIKDNLTELPKHHAYLRSVSPRVECCHVIDNLIQTERSPSALLSALISSVSENCPPSPPSRFDVLIDKLQKLIAVTFNPIYRDFICRIPIYGRLRRIGIAFSQKYPIIVARNQQHRSWPTIQPHVSIIRFYFLTAIDYAV